MPIRMERCKKEKSRASIVILPCCMDMHDEFDDFFHTSWNDRLAWKDYIWEWELVIYPCVCMGYVNLYTCFKTIYYNYLFKNKI